MKGYQTKDEAALAYDANKRYIRAVGHTILQRIMNDALTEMTSEFNEALTVGEIKEVASLEAVEAILRSAILRQLPRGEA